jgi:hypothetical protein
MSRRRNTPSGGGQYPHQYSGNGNSNAYSYSYEAGSSPPSSGYQSYATLPSPSQPVWQPSYEAYQPMNPGDFLNLSGNVMSPYESSAYGEVDSGFVSDASFPHTPQYATPTQYQSPHSPRSQLQSHHPQYAQPIGISPRVPSNASAAMYRTPPHPSYYAPGPGLSMQTAGSQYINPDTQSLGTYHSQPQQQWQQPQGAPDAWGAATPGFPTAPVTPMNSADYWSPQAAQQMLTYSSHHMSPMSPSSRPQYSSVGLSAMSAQHDGSSYGYYESPAQAAQYSASIPPAEATSGGTQKGKPKAPPKEPALHDGKYRREVLVDGRIITHIKLENGELAMPALNRICRNLAVLVNPDTGRRMFPDIDIQEAKVPMLELIGGIEGRPPAKYQPTGTWDKWAMKIRTILADWDEIAKKPGRDGLTRLRASQTHINDSVSVSLRTAFASYDEPRPSYEKT